MKKIVVVGLGNVGMAYVSALVNTKDLVDKIILIDLDRNKAVGEAMDLSHAATVLKSKTQVVAGDYKDCYGADIVVIAAGKNQEQGETRLDLIGKNEDVIKSIVLEVMKYGFDGIFIVATNPVDVMSYAVRKYSKIQNNKVIGTGTLLDTERLKYLLSQKINISTENIHAYVLGEHGDSSFAVWSKSTIGMVPISSTVNKEDLDIIENEMKRSAYNIINYKGFTNYGVANCMLKITKAIINDENVVLNVSSPVDDIYISMPSVVGKSGIKGTMKINFTEEELEKYNKSKKIIEDAIESLEV